MSRVIIKAEEYRLIGTESDKGYSIELSPYDMPREVEGSFDKESGVFHILFKYLDREEAVIKEISESLKMKLGKYSGKILGLEIEVRKGNIREIALVTVQEIDRAIEVELPRLKKYNEKANYKVVKSVIHRNREPIFGALAGANA